MSPMRWSTGGTAPVDQRMKIFLTCRPAVEAVSEPVERGLQRVETERAQVQGLPVELLQVERGTLAGLGVLAGLQPDPLADLVRRGLARPTQVAVDLEAQ